MLSWFQLSPMEWDAIHLSMSVALSSMLWSLPFAIFIAWLLARKEFYGKSLITGVIHLPLVLPPVVIGYLLLVAMGRNGFIGKYLYQWFGVSFGFSWKGAVLASAVVAFPLVVRAIRLSLESIDFKLEQAAQTLGASPWRVFFTITLPLSLPGVFIFWHYCRCGTRFCSLFRGIRGNHYLRFQYCGGNSNHSFSDVFIYPNARCGSSNCTTLLVCGDPFINFLIAFRSIEQTDAEKIGAGRCYTLMYNNN